jgi:hypothetical protein
MIEALLANIRETAGRAGIDWPDDLQAALDEADTLQQTALATPDRQAVSRAVADAFRNGTDPTVDPAVLAALTAYQLAEIVPPGSLRRVADEARRQALQAHADDLHQRLHQAVAAADEVIARARTAVPDLDLTDPDQAPSLHPDAARSWVQARDAVLAVGQALKCRALLATATDQHIEGGGRYGEVLAIADLHADQLDQIRTPRPTFRDVIDQGHRLDLATPSEHRDRIARYADQRDQQETRRANAFRLEYRRTHHAGQLT